MIVLYKNRIGTVAATMIDGAYQIEGLNGPDGRPLRVTQAEIDNAPIVRAEYKKQLAAYGAANDYSTPFKFTPPA